MTKQDKPDHVLETERLLIAVKGARSFLMAIISDDPSPIQRQMQQEIARLTKVIAGGEYAHRMAESLKTIIKTEE